MLVPERVLDGATVSSAIPQDLAASLVEKKKKEGAGLELNVFS